VPHLIIPAGELRDLKRCQKLSVSRLAAKGFWPGCFTVCGRIITLSVSWTCVVGKPTYPQSPDDRSARSREYDTCNYTCDISEPRRPLASIAGQLSCPISVVVLNAARSSVSQSSWGRPGGKVPLDEVFARRHVDQLRAALSGAGEPGDPQLFHELFHELGVDDLPTWREAGDDTDVLPLIDRTPSALLPRRR